METTTTMKNDRIGWGWVALVLFIAFLLRLPSLEMPFETDGGAYAYHARMIVNGDPLYSTHHPSHVLPAIYYTYALVFALFGDAVWTVKLFFAFLAVVKVFLLYQLGKEIINPWIGIVAGLFYAFMSAQIYMDGLSGQIETLANFPRILGVLVLVWAVKAKDRAWHWVLVGALATMAFLCKPVYLSLFAMLGLILFVLLWQEWPNWKLFGLRILWVLGGVLFVLGVLAIHLTITDTWSGFLYVFTLGTKYVGAVSGRLNPAIPTWLAHPLLPVIGLSQNNIALLVVGLVGFIFVVWQARKTWMGLIAVWLVFSFVAGGVNLTLYTHYYILIIPPLSLLAAWFLYQMTDSIPLKSVRQIVSVLMVLFVLGVGFAKEFVFYRSYVAYRLGDMTFREAIVEGYPYFGETTNQAQDVADYIQAQTHPDDEIFVWSGFMQTYYMADRRSSAYIIWPININTFPSEETVLGAQTRYVVIEQEHFPPPDWFQQQLAQMYEFEITIQKHDLYRYVGE